MKAKTFLVPTAISILFTLACILPRMRESWKLPDDNLVSDGQWASSGLSESLEEQPTWRTVKIIAEITMVRDPLNVIPEIRAGDLITGTYTFDSDVSDTLADDPNNGKYRFANAPFGVVLTVGPYTLRTNPRDVDFEIMVGHREFDDRFSFMSRNNVCQPVLRNGDRSGRVELIWWQLHNFTGTALAGDELPTEPPNVANWESLIGLRIDGTVTDRKSREEDHFLIAAKVIRAEPWVP